MCFTLTCIFHILRSNWRFLRFRVSSGHSAYSDTWDVDDSDGGKARWMAFVFFYCSNAPSCGSAAAFDSILVQGTVQRSCPCASLLYAPHTHTSLLLGICAHSVWLQFLTDHHVDTFQ